jgi:hypothetical protein
MVETREGGTRPVLKEHVTPGRGIVNGGPRNEVYAREVAPALKEFVRRGKESISGYEATRIAQGLGISGFIGISRFEAERPHVRGDRLLLSVRDPGQKRSYRTQGLVLNNGAILAVDQRNDLQAYYPEYDNGTRGRARVIVLRLIRPAILDGRLETYFSEHGY